MSVVQRGPAGHDQATGVDDRLPTAGAERRSTTRSTTCCCGCGSRGAIFLRAEYRDPWSYESLTGQATAQILRPGTDRVILFHVVVRGTCWAQVAGGERHWASAGDVIVLPYGDQHRMGGLSDSEAVPLQTIMEAPPWRRMPVIRHGRGRRPDRRRLRLPAQRRRPVRPGAAGVPPGVRRPPPDGPGNDWVRANIDYALAQAEASPLGPDAIPTRLPEMLLIEVLRLHLATAPALDSGWVAALHDPVLNPALAALHAAPGPQVDRCRPRPLGRGVPIAARRQVPTGARPLTHPLPHRVAHPPRPRPARLDRSRRRRHRPPGRLRRRRSLQPGVQTGLRNIACELAHQPPAPLTRPVLTCGDRRAERSIAPPGPVAEHPGVPMPSTGRIRPGWVCPDQWIGRFSRCPPPVPVPTVLLGQRADNQENGAQR